MAPNQGLGLLLALFPGIAHVAWWPLSLGAREPGLLVNSAYLHGSWRLRMGSNPPLPGDTSFQPLLRGIKVMTQSKSTCSRQAMGLGPPPLFGLQEHFQLDISGACAQCPAIGELSKRLWAASHAISERLAMWSRARTLHPDSLSLDRGSAS